MSKRIVWIVLGSIVSIAALVIVTLALTPQETNPAFAAATTFMNAAGKGDDSAAFALLDPAMQAYVVSNCAGERVSACIQSYTPPEWGSFSSAVFRRAAPDGDAWDIELIATYERDKGASGVCIYHRLERDSSGTWRVAGWAGFVSCGDPRSRNMAGNSAVVNHAP